ncbi:hypothetical protein [Streptomyces sp. NPDC057702]|uniref:helix-turn-helix transcriptional regulator n=1 Tax=Streptomyces sp. NPDC057702 TaxID=3346221 RepID=UPI003688C810
MNSGPDSATVTAARSVRESERAHLDGGRGWAPGARTAAGGGPRDPYEAAGLAYAHPTGGRQRPAQGPREHLDRGLGWADGPPTDRAVTDRVVVDHAVAGPGRGADRWAPRGEREGAGGPDAVEHALRQVCELIESAVTLHRRCGEQPASVAVADDGPAARRTVHQLVARARHSVSVIVSGCPDQAQPLAPLLDQLHAVAGRGVAVRILCAADALEAPGIATAVRRGLAGHEVRVETGDLQGGVIVDGQTAFVHAGPGQPGRYASVIEDPASVRVLDLMFAAAWRTAMPMAEHLRLADRLRTDSVRRILDRLRAGRTDDVAAREIQVSLRTYRRHVAAIMRDVGANSRFQAGVRAYELGLLGPA